IKNGLMDNVVRDIIEDKDHNIWIGSNAGISIYEANKQHVYNPVAKNLFKNLTKGIILDLYVDSKGKVLVGTFGNGVLIYDGDELKHITSKDGLANDIVYSILEDSKGNYWFGTNNGISKYDGQNFNSYTDIEGLENNYVSSIIEDHEGNLLFGINGSGVLIFSYKEQNTLDIKRISTSEGLNSNFIATIYQDNNDDIWIGTWGKGVNKIVSEKSSITEGIFTFEYFGIQEGLRNSNITTVFEDIENNVWIGTYGAGLSMFRDKSFTKYNLNESLQDNFVFSLTEDNNKNIWVGTGANGVSIFSPKENSRYHYSIKSITTKDGLINNFVRIVFCDKGGKMWVGTSEGVSRYDGKTFEHLTIDNGLIHNYVRTIHEDQQGNFWLGTPAGISVVTLNNDNFSNCNISNYTEEDGLTPGTVYSFAEDNSGNIWIGTELGISKFDSVKFKNYSVADGLVHSDVRTILMDKENKLWIGTGGGISIFDGDKFENLTMQDGLSSNRLYLMLFDEDDDVLWIGTNVGVDKFDAKEYRSSKTTKFKHFGHLEGFQGVETNTNAVCKDSEGGLWFGTINGAIKYDPLAVKQKNNLPPQTHITKVRIAKKDTMLQSNIKLPYNMNYFTFHYIGISLTLPEKVVYQYKLEGYDEDWSEITQETFATYGNVPTGGYTFKVRARNNDGVWNEKPTELVFSVIPAFWQTWWFYLSSLISLSALIFALIQFRERNLKRAKNILEEKIIIRTQEIEDQKEELREVNQHIIDSISYAKNIQRAILKPIDELNKYVPESFIYYEPKEIVSGDFYWLGNVKNNGTENIMIAAVDCTGHGVPGAFMSMIGNDLLNQIIIEKKVTNPGEILNQLHAGVQFSLQQKGEDALSKDGMDIALCNLDIKNNKLQFAGAHRSLHLFRKDEEEIEIVKANKIGIGGIEEVERDFINHEILLEKGDTFYIFSDGVVDQFGGPKFKKYSSKRLKKFLAEFQNLDMAIQMDKLVKEITGWKGELDQTDDITVIGVRI
ncbi:MAG: SpoIIE family protein phosphatase, partial [Bacteroidia bacterium]|nr:SpoIIE family protein phosphatase [Bacteroidia bacterium]